MSLAAPFIKVYSYPGAAVAQASSAGIAVAVAPFDGTVTGVTYAASVAITGAATNTRKLTLYNRKQDGTGTTVVATLQFNSGTNAAAYDETAITLSGTAANLAVAAGDVLAWQSDSVGTGLADPGGLVTITLSRA